jgi:DNA-binding HxlR family transcriptional regulator
METKKDNIQHSQQLCTSKIRPVTDALVVLSGRWKLPILVSLTFGTKRFKQIAKDINGITDKMLSKELKDLEANQLVKRTVYDSFPPTVEYSITEHGKTLKKVIDELGEWGMFHRKKIIGK